MGLPEAYFSDTWQFLRFTHSGALVIILFR
jgi:hypothetical protein